MPTLIVGGGALGSFLAARLVQAGNQVCMLARGERLTTIRREGLLLQAGDTVQQIPVEVRADCRGLGKTRLVVLCTKAGALSDALDQIEDAVGVRTGIVTVQNGVEAPEIVARGFPDVAIIASRVHGFFELSGGNVRHVGVEPSIVFGQVHGPETGAGKQLHRLLHSAGIACAMAPDITSALWQKFVLASAFGGVGAATGLAAGPMRGDAEAWRLLAAALQEVCDLASIKGVALPPHCKNSTLDFIASFPHGASTSMKRDLEAGRPSEYQSLTGAVIRMAKEVHAAVPTFNTIEAMIAARGLFP